MARKLRDLQGGELGGRWDGMRVSLCGFHLFLLASLASAQVPVPAPTLESFLLTPQLWESTPQSVEEPFKAMGFMWTSATKDSARAANPGLALRNRRVWEVIARFPGGKLSELTLNLYNRGDSGELGEREFEELRDAEIAAITSFTGKQHLPLPKNAASAVKAEGVEWVVDGSTYTMEWSITKESRTKFRPEFIRLTVAPTPARRPIGSATPSTSSQRQATKKFVGREHVERLPDGDVRLKDVPMVDQGQKGYCVVASAERVMRFYGVDVDQHELAQMANSNAKEGTSPAAMLASLKGLTARLGVRAKSLYELFESDTDFLKLIEDYNRLANRAKEEKKKVYFGKPGTTDMGDCYRQMDLDLFKQLRMKEKADFEKFRREIQRGVAEGIPLLWSVVLGLVPEHGLGQASGGHMRLVIGYNTKTNEIIYSDSWGAGHEQKRMGCEDAWTITTGLSTIQPL